MADKNPELRVVRQSRDGRRRYDVGGKRALVEAALRPGVSVARLAQEHGINANLLRKWITKYLIEREKGVSSASQDNDADGRNGPHAPKEIPLSDAVEVISQGDFLRGVDGVPIDVPGPRKHSLSAESPSAFVPVVSVPPALQPALSLPSMTFTLHVRLSNGVEFDLGEASVDELTTVVQMLGRLPCSGSTKT